MKRRINRRNVEIEDDEIEYENSLKNGDIY